MLRLRGFGALDGAMRLGPVELDVAAGEYACVLAPGKAGKTLLLRAVGGLVAHSGAMVAARCGLIAQDGGLHLHATVEDAIRFGMAAGGVRRPDRARRLAWLLDEFGLKPRARCAALGADDRLKARVAAAVAGQPAVLLLDDPLGACDDVGALIDLLRGPAWRRGIAVLHATRRRQEAFGLADRLVLLENGRVLQQGTPAAVYESPETLFIARRLGSTNVLEGRIEEIEDDVAFVRLACGPLIEADAPRDVPPVLPAAGIACQVVLRPERISVSALAASDLGGAAVPALLLNVTHMGDAFRLTVAIGTDTELAIVRPAAIGAAGLVAGRQVSVAWQSRHALTYLR